MNTVTNVLIWLGALSFFFYALRQLMTVVQKEGSGKLHSLSAKLSNNQLKAIINGSLLGFILQSSVAGLQLILNTLNTEKQNLRQGIGSLVGQNLGTVLTLWVLYAFNFTYSLSLVALVLVAIVYPIKLIRTKKKFLLADFIFGVAILYLSLHFLHLMAIEANGIFDFSGLGNTFYHRLLFLFMGALLMVLFQSPIAVWLLALALLMSGQLHFSLALSLVLGESLAGMIIVFFYVRHTNRTAKRAGLSYTFFYAAQFLSFFLPLEFWISKGDELLFQSVVYSETLHLISMYSFMVGAHIAVFWWTIPQLEKVCLHLIPPQETNDNESKLKYIRVDEKVDMEQALHDSRREIAVYARRVAKLYSMVLNLYHEKETAEFYAIFSRIEKYESIVDRMELEIAEYLSRYVDASTPHKELTILENKLKAISDIESIADTSYVMAKKIEKKFSAKIQFLPESETELLRMLYLVQDALAIMYANIDDYGQFTHNQSMGICDNITDLKSELKKDQLNNLRNKKYAYQETSIFNDLLSEAEEVGSYIMDVVDSFYIIDYQLKEKDDAPNLLDEPNDENVGSI